MKFICALLLLVSPFLSAQCVDNEELCATVGKWDFSIGLGAGVLTNPLHDGENIPLVIVPSFSYYGERVFFQNNTLGYTLYENESIAFSAITLINNEYAYFNRWHPQNIFLPKSSSDVIDQSPSESFQPDISYKKVAKRKWALDVGAQLNWFISNSVNAEFKVLHDVNKAYRGFNANAEVSKVFRINEHSVLEVTLGAQWNSEALVDYYYGISADETSASSSIYQGKAGVNPYLNIGYAYRINDEWQLKAFLKRKKLSSNIYLSPIVQDTTVDLIFMGFFYEF